jgi:hypothetical protein
MDELKSNLECDVFSAAQIKSASAALLVSLLLPLQLL